MKMHILPPSRVKTGNSYWFRTDARDFTTAWGVLHEVAPDYRYRRAISSEVKRDLLRFASLNGYPVYVGITDTGRPTSTSLARWRTLGSTTAAAPGSSRNSRRVALGASSHSPEMRGVHERLLRHLLHRLGSEGPQRYRTRRPRRRSPGPPHAGRQTASAGR